MTAKQFSHSFSFIKRIFRRSEKMWRTVCSLYMRLSSSLVNRCLTYVRVDRSLQIKTIRLLIIINIIMFSPLIILFYFNLNLINGFETAKNQSIDNDFVFQIGLDPQNLYRLFWTVDYQSESLTLEVRTVLNNEYDWFAIGFSDYGELFGADLCILWADRKRKLHFQVRHQLFVVFAYNLWLNLCKSEKTFWI